MQAREAHEERGRLTRLDPEYAWARCPSADCSGNTVKFGADGSLGVCPACSTAYEARGAECRRVGEVVHEDPHDDEDRGVLTFDIRARDGAA